MRIDILTLFPQMFESAFGYGILKRAIDQERLDIQLHNIREYTHDKHRTVDDYPYSGGPGMVMKPEPIFEAVEAVTTGAGSEKEKRKLPVILLTPQGRLFTQRIARELAEHPRLVLLCGRYEGVDERVRQHLATDEISIGDYVLTGGEFPAMVVVDSVARLLPGVLGADVSLLEESHSEGLLEYPQYTRPEVYRRWKVPEVLLSGNHAEVARWRREQGIRRTLEKRPDLLAKTELGREEQRLVERLVPAAKQGNTIKETSV